MNVIDTDNYAAAGIETFVFPGGEPHVNVPKWRFTTANIFAKVRNTQDMFTLLCVIDALETQGVTPNLLMPYLPGARQDRNPDGLTPLTSRIYGDMLRTIRGKITYVDVHSEAALSNFIGGGSGGKFRELEFETFLPDLITEKFDYILAPDKGALDRADRAADALGISVLQCLKTRNFETGYLETSQVPYLSPDKKYLVFDDICDGGATFLGILDYITKRDSIIPDNISLYVTHGIFSKGTALLTDRFEHVYTTNSFYQPPTLEMNANPVISIDLLPYYIGGLTP